MPGGRACHVLAMCTHMAKAVPSHDSDICVVIMCPSSRHSRHGKHVGKTKRDNSLWLSVHRTLYTVHHHVRATCKRPILGRARRIPWHGMVQSTPSAAAHSSTRAEKTCLPAATMPMPSAGGVALSPSTEPLPAARAPHCTPIMAWHVQRARAALSHGCMHRPTHQPMISPISPCWRCGGPARPARP